ncbi:hypothetical protein LguiA_020606 [Lonicera macranthoides]
MYLKEEMRVIEDEVENFVAGGFDPMEGKQEEDPMIGTFSEGEIWECLNQQENLQDVNDFPLLEDFQCMSPSQTTLLTSSSFASSIADDAFSQSLAGLDIDIDINCMDVMENFGLDTTGIWDPSSIFDSEIENPAEKFQAQQQNPLQDQEQLVEGQSEQKPQFDELGAMFFEWVKNNKDYISAEDMRSIKIKKNTIASAWKRLGNTKEGQKQLLQLILQWVEQYLLHKKATTQYQNPCFQNQNPIFSPNLSFDPNACLFPSPCFPTLVLQPPPFNNSPPTIEFNNNFGQSWGPIQYNPYLENINLQPPGVYGDSYSVDAERLLRQGNSATKEARKKRMARQKRVLAQNRNVKNNQGDDQCDVFINGGENWVICSPGGVSACVYPTQSVPTIIQGPQAGPVMDAAPLPADQLPSVLHAPKCSRQVPLEKRLGFKPEKSLKFLLQKVLKQSDVGDFVRANGLQAEDFIVIYLDVKSGKYLIRGVKVRQPGQKSESKKPSRRNQRGSAKAGNRSVSSPAKETV